jgi:hypothetical protein
MSAPYIIGPLLAVVAVIIWWLRGRVSDGQVSGLKERLSLAAERISFADQRKDEVEKQLQLLKSPEIPTSVSVVNIETAIREFLKSYNTISAAVGGAHGVSSAKAVGAEIKH